MEINKIKNEDDYVKHLSSLGQQEQTTKFDLLREGFKESMDNAYQEAVQFMKDNPVTADLDEETKELNYSKAIELWNNFASIVKSEAKCVWNINNLELSVIFNKLHNACEYTAETLFYGLHLKNTFVNSFPKFSTVAKDNYNTQEIEISLSNCVALYHILSELKVKGLNKENYAFGNILYMLSEFAKIYTHYNNLSMSLSKDMSIWNMGIQNSDARFIEKAVTESMIEEIENK